MAVVPNPWEVSQYLYLSWFYWFNYLGGHLNDSFKVNCKNYYRFKNFEFNQISRILQHGIPETLVTSIRPTCPKKVKCYPPASKACR